MYLPGIPGWPSSVTPWRVDVITEGTGSRSRDGAEDLFLLAKYSVLSTCCNALHLHVIFSLALFSEFA